MRATSASHTRDVPYATSSANGDHDGAGADYVNSDSSLLDEVLRLYGTRLDGTQRQRFRGSRDDGQTECGHGSTT